MLDADSHVMELPDFLSAHADPGLRDRIPPVNFDSGGKLVEAPGQLQRVSAATSPRSSTSRSASATSCSPAPRATRRIGAFDTAERSQALDLLGFERQFVFASFSTERRVRRPPRRPTSPPARPAPTTGRWPSSAPASRA